MSDISTFNIIVGVAGALGGWWMKVMWESLKDLQAADTALVSKVASIEILVAGSYIKRDEFTALSDALFKKLDRIEDKVDAKADKQ